MDVRSAVRDPLLEILTLVGLQHLPCGCVAGVYKADFDAEEVELVEAKGPHCVFFGHRDGKFIEEDPMYTGDRGPSELCF